MLPKQCDVVIFDREGCHEIIEYILKNKTDYTIVDSYIKHYYFHPFFLFLYIKNLISSTFTLAREQHAEISCKPWESLAIIFAR